jgi:hypothetical protein
MWLPPQGHTPSVYNETAGVSVVMLSAMTSAVSAVHLRIVSPPETLV